MVLEVDKLLLVDLNFFDFLFNQERKNAWNWQVEENYILVHYDRVDTVKMVKIDQILFMILPVAFLVKYTLRRYIKCT